MTLTLGSTKFFITVTNNAAPQPPKQPSDPAAGKGIEANNTNPRQRLPPPMSISSRRRSQRIQTTDASPEYGVKRHEALNATRSLHKYLLSTTTHCHIPRMTMDSETSLIVVGDFAYKGSDHPPQRPNQPPPRHEGV